MTENIDSASIAERNKAERLASELAETARKSYISPVQVQEYREKLRELEKIAGIPPEHYSMPGARPIDELSQAEHGLRMSANEKWVRSLPKSYMMASCGFTWRVRIKMWWGDFIWPIRRHFLGDPK